MASTGRVLTRTACITGTAVSLLVVGVCAAMFISASRSTDETDAAGLTIVSAVMVGGAALVLSGLFLWMTIALWKPSTIAPGWYADPVGETSYRYWDGTAWTAHLAPPKTQ